MKISRRNFLKVLGSATGRRSGSLRRFFFHQLLLSPAQHRLPQRQLRHYLYDEYRLGHECISPLHRRAAEL